MNLPKISVITVSFNQGEFIRQNIESVLSQNYPNFEHLIIDGGSNDSTISILREYPHLKWTSEPDRGQSDALNKGFSRASGDIIAWLNSDDWYAPNIFFDVASALEQHPVVLGMAEQTDKAGCSTEVVRNTPRSFYDLWRYWVPYAWVAQPSIFFRKSLLESVRRPDGSYVDEDLYFTMDSDLWMRIASQYPFSNYLPKTLSYFRVYDSNKTGARPLATQRECSRIFKRYNNRGDPQEQALSFIIAADKPSESLKRSVISLVSQNSAHFDIIISDYSADRASAKHLREFSLDLSEAIQHITVRYVRSEKPDPYSAFYSAIRKACAPLVSLLQAGDTVSPNFSSDAINAFSRDVVGMILPQIGSFNPKQFLYPKSDTLDLGGVLNMPHFFPNLVARRIALLEFDGFSQFECYPLALKQLILDIIFKNWAVLCEEKLLVQPESPAPDERAQNFLSNNQMAIIASISLHLKSYQEFDPFYSIRSAMRNPQVLADALQEAPEMILSRLSKDWQKML